LVSENLHLTNLLLTKFPTVQPPKEVIAYGRAHAAGAADQGSGEIHHPADHGRGQAVEYRCGMWD